ncbi:MAG: hypothetical protein KGP14_01770 [Betaproteobacteria bacterium]|nr:hypothetical protein [Betaproteobacteria bacterium]
MHAYINTTIEIDQTAYARVLLAMDQEPPLRHALRHAPAHPIRGRPSSQITSRVKKGESAFPASVVQCMSASMPEEDRSALIDQMQSDDAEEWFPNDEGNFQGECGEGDDE